MLQAAQKKFKEVETNRIEIRFRNLTRSALRRSQSGFALLGRGPLDSDRRVREPEELVIQTADWARQHELQYLG